jgi:branched-chain amino acid transport system permease protein
VYWRIGSKDRLIVLALLSTAVALVAAWPADDGAPRFCRGLLPALHDSGTRIDVRDVAARRTLHGALVTIVYASDGTPTRRAVTCIFREDNRRLELTNLATEDGPLGDVRLHLLKRYWIDSGRMAAADPVPVQRFAFAPEVSRGVAVLVQQLVAALPGVAIYTLLAAAYALIYGLVGRINLAFGELAVLAGYGAFLGHSLAPSSAAWPVALVFAVFTAAVHGGMLGWRIFALLLDRPGQQALIATAGMALVWSEAVRLLQGAGNRWIEPVSHSPVGLATAGEFVVTLAPVAVLAAAASLITLTLVLRFLSASRFGRRWRAVADDPTTAALLAIDPRRVILETMLLAGVIAGLAGLITTLVYGGVGLGGGLAIGLKALIAAVIGGIGSVGGAVAGAMLVGVAEALWAAAFAIEYRDAALFAALALLLIQRPEGLFGVASATRRDC